MNPNTMIQRLKYSAGAVHSLVADVSAEQARWKPDPVSWSILEVVNHLYDEERLDFRMRVDYFLNRPDEDPPRIDPPGWVTAHQYNQRNLDDSLKNFLEEREKSLAWLGSLQAPDWEASHKMPFGEIRAGDVFVAWAAHDLLHLRQLVELRYSWTIREAQPFDVRYAGEW